METEFIITTEDGVELTTENEVSLVAYTKIDGLDYGLAIDWNGDGEYDNWQEADRMVRWSCSRGREKLLAPAGGGFNSYEIGKLILTLDNYDGRYNPYSVGSPLYGSDVIGNGVQLKVTSYDEVEGWDNHFVFTGVIVDFNLNGNNQTVTVVAEDGWRFLSDCNYKRLPFTTGSNEEYGELADIYLFDLVFNSGSINYNYVYDYRYPWGMAFDYHDFEGITRIPRHWWWSGSAKSAVEMITFATLGMSWVMADGRVNFRHATGAAEDSAVTEITEPELLKDIALNLPWETTRSEVLLQGTNRLIYNAAQVVSIDEPIKVNTGDTVALSFNYKYGDKDVVCAKVTDITISAYANANGTGANLTSFIETRLFPEANSLEATFHNQGETDAYITAFTVVGEPLELVDARWKKTNPSNLSTAFVLNNQWLNVTSISQGTYIEETETTKADRERVELIRDSLSAYLEQKRRMPVIKLQNRWRKQFLLELEDLVDIDLPSFDLSGGYRVAKIKHDMGRSSQDVITTVWLYYPIYLADIILGG